MASRSIRTPNQHRSSSTRILTERRQKWEAEQLAKFAAAKKEPPKNWKAKYVEPTPPDTTNLPELPEGWCWASVEQVNLAERPMSYGVLQPEWPDLANGVPMVRVCDVADGKVAIEELKRIHSSISQQYHRTILQSGEILLTIVGTIGRTAIASSRCLSGANTARAVAVIPLTRSVDRNSLLKSAFAESGMRSRLTQAAHEVARKTLNLEDVRVACIPLAPLSEQRQDRRRSCRNTLADRRRRSRHRTRAAPCRSPSPKHPEASIRGQAGSARPQGRTS